MFSSDGGRKRELNPPRLEDLGVVKSMLVLGRDPGSILSNNTAEPSTSLKELFYIIIPNKVH